MGKNARIYAVGVIACAATVGLAAQTARQQRSASEDTRRFVVIGCVSRETQGGSTASPGAATGARFIITDTRGGGRASVYRLDGEQTQLELHVGHTLEIAGPISPARSSAGRGPNADTPVLKVESLTYISKSCQKF